MHDLCAFSRPHASYSFILFSSRKLLTTEHASRRYVQCSAFLARCPGTGCLARATSTPHAHRCTPDWRCHGANTRPAVKHCFARCLRDMGVTMRVQDASPPMPTDIMDVVLRPGALPERHHRRLPEQGNECSLTSPSLTSNKPTRTSDATSRLVRLRGYCATASRAEAARRTH